MKKIVFLPLDERPCNYAFPGKLFSAAEIVTPDRLGDKKHPADAGEIAAFLVEQCADADGLVLSMDMLLYGGLLPSRLHHLSEETVSARLALAAQLKQANARLKIYAFQCIMRCPSYSSSDEEPDYYETYGEQIHRCGAVRHKRLLGMSTEAEEPQIPADVLNDYIARRSFNLSFVLRTLELVEAGCIDYLVIPQDDSAPYGFTALDQQQVREAIARRHLQTRAVMYPGADEVALTLMTRMLLGDRKPKVYVRYAAHSAPNVIPAYEDRSLGETIKAHLMAAGCRMTDSAEAADLILGITCPGGKMEEAAAQPVRNAAYCVERNLTEFTLALGDWIAEGKPVTVCDNAYANGADLEFIDLLDKNGLLDRLSGYAGWNTSSNSLGTAIAQGVYTLLFGQPNRDFLALRYVEDALYCAIVRKLVTDTRLEELGMNYFDVRETTGTVSRMVHTLLEEKVKEVLPSIAPHIQLNTVQMPWRRMFEADLDVHWHEQSK